eukprot:Pgem_evm1s9693
MDEMKNVTGKPVKTLEKEMLDNAKEGFDKISRPYLFQMFHSVYVRTQNAFQELEEKYSTLVLSYREEKQKEREHKFKIEEQKRLNPGNPNAGIILVSFNF